MSVGPLIYIAYHVPGMERRRQVIVAGDGNCAGGNDARELGVVVRGNTEVRCVEVRPVVPVIIDKVQATMRLSIRDADAIYLNGYNSWTDSVEHAVTDRMWGLSRAPRQSVENSVLDASGDYRFCEEDTRCGHMHGYGYGYLRQGEEVLLFGSLCEDTGMTVIYEDLDEGTLTFEKEPPLGIIGRGEHVEVLSLGLLGGRLEDCVERYLELCGITCREATPIVGYTSWYRHYQDIDAETLMSDLAGEAKVIDDCETSGVDVLFQIDDGYAKVGDWLEYDESRFPEGLVPLAEAAHEHGMLAGLWLAPFMCERKSRLFAERPEWLLRDERGRLVEAGGNWSGAYALDLRMPEVRDHIAKVLATVTDDWGFDLLKLDFLYAACLEAHDNMNRGQLMADALDFLRECVGEDVRLLLCGVPLTSAFGRCEYCRIGPDVGRDWDDLPFARLLARERVSTKRSLANARGRAHLNGRAFLCDPDVLYLREEGVSLTASQRVEMFVADTTFGGVLLTSDDMGKWDEAQLMRYREALARFRRSCGVA